jgi:hypothetical protein
LEWLLLGIPPHDWQKTFLLAPRGASIAVLTARHGNSASGGHCAGLSNTITLEKKALTVRVN